MKRDVRREESFIFAIYNIRNNTNEILLILPFILVLAFVLVGVPVIMVLCELSLILLPVLILGPVLCVSIFYIVRKKIIMSNFVRIRDVSDRIDLTEVCSDTFETAVDGRVFMFGYSEYMQTVLYNWLLSLNVTGDKKLKMYKVFYDNRALVYLAIAEAELNIPEQCRAEYERETRNCLQLSDMMRGKAVDVKVCSRLTK